MSEKIQQKILSKETLVGGVVVSAIFYLLFQPILDFIRKFSIQFLGTFGVYILDNIAKLSVRDPTSVAIQSILYWVLAAVVVSFYKMNLESFQLRDKIAKIGLRIDNLGRETDIKDQPADTIEVVRLRQKNIKLMIDVMCIASAFIIVIMTATSLWLFVRVSAASENRADFFQDFQALKPGLTDQEVTAIMAQWARVNSNHDLGLLQLRIKQLAKARGQPLPRR